MHKFIKSIIGLTVSAAVMISGAASSFADEREQREYLQSYVLMETSTGTVIREKNGGSRVRTGSLNKLMTVLLAAEAIERGELTFETELTASENANSKQGAQIWLDIGEKMPLGDLLKAVIIGNANDACCVIAEKIGGTEEKFTELMNNRAAELGMKDTLYTECTGYYDDDKQYSTAYDCALLCAELSKHTDLKEMFTTRVDELNGGEVQLVTSNPMCFKYKGSLGFKCGSGPSSAYYAAECAEREGICYTAVVLDCKDEDTALAVAAELLDIAFGGYTVISTQVPEDMPETVEVKKGCSDNVRLALSSSGNVVVSKGAQDDIEAKIIIPSYVYAPVEKGDRIGEVRYFIGDEVIKTCPVIAAENSEEKNFNNVLTDLMKFLVSF